MQSTGSFAAIFRNPTFIAMFGSAVIHGILALFTLLMPANSRPRENMRLVGIIPAMPAAPNQNPSPSSTLPVPNAPPLGTENGESLFGSTDLGKFMQFPPSPGEKLNTSPSQTSVIPLGNGLKIPTSDIPQKSLGQRTFGLGGSSVGSGKTGKLATPKIATRQSYDPSQWGTNPNATPPKLQPGSSGSGLFPDAGSGSYTSPFQQIENQSSALRAKQTLTAWIARQSQQVGQPLSTQNGGTLTAAFPASACGAGRGADVSIAARFGTDGRYSGNLVVIEPSDIPGIDEVAAAKVQSQQVPAAKIQQVFNFKVSVPYSASVCGSQAPTTPSNSTGTSTTPGILPTVKPTKAPIPSQLPTPIAPDPNTPSAPATSPGGSAPKTGPVPDNGLRPDAPLPGTAPIKPAPAPVAPTPPPVEKPAPVAPASVAPTPAPPAPTPPAAPPPAPEPAPAPAVEPLPSASFSPSPAPDPAPAGNPPASPPP